MKLLISICLLVVAVIHLLSLSGVLGAAQLNSLYGLPIEDPNLLLLMRHRAVLFGLLGMLLLTAAFRPSLQSVALIAAWGSVGSFLLLAMSVPTCSDQIATVVRADQIALAPLLVASIAWFAARRRR